jgi:hypothetical protein
MAAAPKKEDKPATAKPTAMATKKDDQGGK